MNEGQQTEIKRMTDGVYQELALRTAPDRPGPRTADIEITGEQKQFLLAAIGLCGEAGEVAEIIKKHVFHNHPIDRERLIKEAGDVLWYLNYLLARCCGSGLWEAKETNIKKLSARYPEGFFSSTRSINRAEDDE